MEIIVNLLICIKMIHSRELSWNKFWNYKTFPLNRKPPDVD